MEHQIERMSKKAVYGIAITTPVVVFALLNHYFYYADLFPQLSKWPRRGVLLLAGLAFTGIITSTIIKVWPIFFQKNTTE